MSDLLYFNGINGATGQYGLAATTEQLVARIKGESPPENLPDLNKKMEMQEAIYGTVEGVDATDLSQAGWGVIFVFDPAQHQKNEAIKEALSALLKLRESQAGPYYQVFEGPKRKGGGYRPGETKVSFLARNGVGAGPVDPVKGVPYYLLIVGSPADVSCRFQYQLDVQFAVGRIDFGDDLDAYAKYATSVVMAETGGVQLPRKVSFFGVENPDDKATALSREHLVQPLYEKLSTRSDLGATGWQMDAWVRERATKAQLQRLLAGDQTPALLFTASHGMEFPQGDPRQIPHQGALLCQDWPGPNEWRQAIPQDHYLAGDDLTDEDNLMGLIAFYFACYGAGTPLWDEFSGQAPPDRRTIAPYPFMAALPTRMLSQGALAVIGHVERAWGYSFFWPRAGEQTAVFESTLASLLKGHPLGSAFDYFNERYAELSTDLTSQIDDIVGWGRVDYDSQELIGLWTANNDARGYVIVGDPAVRLPVVKTGTDPILRPTIEVEYEFDPSSISPPPPAEAVIQKPDGITEQDWQQTPLAVQQYIQRLQAQLGQREA